MSTENIKRSGMLRIKTDGCKAEINVEGSAEDIMFNLTALAATVADDLNMPVEILLMVVAGNVKNMRKDIQKDIRVDTGAIERVVGRGGDQKN